LLLIKRKKRKKGKDQKEKENESKAFNLSREFYGNQVENKIKKEICDLITKKNQIEFFF
jgi:hypothetical protein